MPKDGRRRFAIPNPYTDWSDIKTGGISWDYPFRFGPDPVYQNALAQNLTKHYDKYIDWWGVHPYAPEEMDNRFETLSYLGELHDDIADGLYISKLGQDGRDRESTDTPDALENERRMKAESRRESGVGKFDSGLYSQKEIGPIIPQIDRNYTPKRDPYDRSYVPPSTLRRAEQQYIFDEIDRLEGEAPSGYELRQLRKAARREGFRTRKEERYKDPADVESPYKPFPSDSHLTSSVLAPQGNNISRELFRAVALGTDTVVPYRYTHRKSKSFDTPKKTKLDHRRRSKYANRISIDPDVFDIKLG